MAYSQYATVPTGAGNTVVSASPCDLGVAVVTTAGSGSGSVNFYNNASTNSGDVLLAIPATVAVGVIYPIDGKANVGITVTNVSNGPALTVYYN